MIHLGSTAFIASILVMGSCREIVVKLRNAPSAFGAGLDDDPLNRLSRFAPHRTFVPLVKRPSPALAFSAGGQSELEEYNLKAAYNLTQYAYLDVPEEQVEATISELGSNPDVETAWARPDVKLIPDPADATPAQRNMRRQQDMSICSGNDAYGCQAYLYDQTPLYPFKLGGHNILPLHHKYPYKGKYARVWSMEAGHYFFGHQDLPFPDFWVWHQEMHFTATHDTGSVGILASLDNGMGPTGIAAGASLNFIRFAGTKGWNLLAALAQPGDAVHCGMCYVIKNNGRTEDVPVDAQQDASDMFRYLTEVKGVHITIAAGNSGQDLKTHRTPRLRIHDNGGIYAGAVNAREGKRAGFSNFGERIDLFSWGTDVASTTTGPEDKCVKDDAYTYTFSGTSSANPIISGITALLQSICFKEGYGAVPPKLMREALANTGKELPIRSNDGYKEVMPDATAALEYLFARLPRGKPLPDREIPISCDNWGENDETGPVGECNSLCRQRCANAADIVECMMEAKGDYCVHASGAGGNLGVSNPAHRGKLGDDRTLNYFNGGHCPLKNDGYNGNAFLSANGKHDGNKPRCKPASGGGSGGGSNGGNSGGSGNGGSGGGGNGGNNGGNNSGGNCRGVPAWDRYRTYNIRQEEVSYKGKIYKQHYWNIGEEPDKHNGPYGMPWEVPVDC